MSQTSPAPLALDNPQPASSSSSSTPSTPSSSSSARSACPPSRSCWVDPALLPSCGDVSAIGGNAPYWVKHLTNNTYVSYGVGDADCFAHAVGRAVRWTDLSICPNAAREGALEAVAVAEVTVAKNMLNGAGMMHGGCISYLIDICGSTPLVALGLHKNVNGAGVTQSMNINFHSPAPLGTLLRISSSTMCVGARIMSSRCEITIKHSGRLVASAFVNKMQPIKSRL